MDTEKIVVEDRPRIIVGIDFGTTYSGIAWAQTRRPKYREEITSWPRTRENPEAMSSAKVPTKLRYTKNKTEWGFSIDHEAHHAEVYEWFKLGLGPSVVDFYRNTIQTPTSNPDQRDADSLVADYLEALIDHFLYILRNKLGETVVRTTPLDFVLTVPAIWTESANERTRKACERAMQRANNKSPIQIVLPITLVSEPEAAAISALDSLDPHSLKIGDTMVVVDAGGGTVDLISYTITALEPILEVKEAAPGSGALCGSVFLNATFADFLRNKLGHVQGFDAEVLADAMDSFETTVKRQFTLGVPPNETYKISVGGLEKNKELGISKGRFALKASELKDIFDPVVSAVIELVKDQIAKSRVPIKAVLLVGGFGASPYLRERIRNAIGRSIEILQPAKAWQAIVQGAVMKGLANSAPDRLTMVSVRGRRARKHYGTDIYVQYDEKVHGHMACEPYWNEFYGYKAVNCIQWFITRGHEILENQPFIRTFVYRQPVAAGRVKAVSATILADATSHDAPVFRNDNVRHLATLKADMTDISKRKLSRCRGIDGKEWYVIEFSIELVYRSASTQYTLIYKVVS